MYKNQSSIIKLHYQVVRTVYSAYIANPMSPSNFISGAITAS